MLWIICGPSSSGKSTFLEAPSAAALTGLPSTTPLLYAHAQSAAQIDLRTDYYLHYNFLRFLDPLNKHYESTKFSWGIVASGGIDQPFDHACDTTWDHLASLPILKKAAVLVTSRAMLLERVQSRAVCDPRLRDSLTYPQSSWQDVYSTIDLAAGYENFLNYLDRKQIEYLLINSMDRTYPIIKDFESASKIINS